MAERPVLTWPQIEVKIAAWEAANPATRITRITSDLPDTPVYFRSLSNECEIGHGAPAIRLSSGEVIEL